MNELELNKGKEELLKVLIGNEMILECKTFTSVHVANLLNKANGIHKNSMSSYTTYGMYSGYVKPILDGLESDGKITKIGNDTFNIV